MKKLFLFMLIAATLCGCMKAGKVTDGNLRMIIHGKEYKFMQVIPAKGHDPIWVMYPKDSTGNEPVILIENSQTIVIN